MWNIPPHDKKSYFKLYLLRDRGFLIANDLEYYYPKVQLEKVIEFDEKKSYGTMQLPEEWASVMNSFAKLSFHDRHDVSVFYKVSRS